MPETDYPEVLIVESDVPCPVLDQLPRLPVRIHVLDARGQSSDPSTLSDTLAQLAEDLGAAEGVEVRGSCSAGWTSRLGSGSGRWDGLVLLPPHLPPHPDDPTEPADEVYEALRGLLANLGVRFLVFAPSPEAQDAEELARRVKLVGRLRANGGPATVLLPVEWPEGVVTEFVTTFLERILHDASLERAVSRASVGRFELPTIFQPAGPRNGLDLGRILEEHRRRMDALSAAMKTFGRELEAAGRSLGGEGWAERLGRVAQRVESLETARLACEEINRDRDPAGWSRLAANRELLDVLKDDDNVDRELLVRQLAAAPSSD
jgi:hypothetical protein